MTARQALGLAASLACAAATTTCAVIAAVLTPSNEPTEWEGQP